MCCSAKQLKVKKEKGKKCFSADGVTAPLCHSKSSFVVLEAVIMTYIDPGKSSICAEARKKQ